MIISDLLKLFMYYLIGLITFWWDSCILCPHWLSTDCPELAGNWPDCVSGLKMVWRLWLVSDCWSLLPQDSPNMFQCRPVGPPLTVLTPDTCLDWTGHQCWWWPVTHCRVSAYYSPACWGWSWCSPATGRWHSQGTGRWTHADCPQWPPPSSPHGTPAGCVWQCSG